MVSKKGIFFLSLIVICMNINLIACGNSQMGCFYSANVYVYSESDSVDSYNFDYMVEGLNLYDDEDSCRYARSLQNIGGFIVRYNFPKGAYAINFLVSNFDSVGLSYQLGVSYDGGETIYWRVAGSNAFGIIYGSPESSTQGKKNPIFIVRIFER